jgi:hypothetical protein
MLVAQRAQRFWDNDMHEEGAARFRLLAGYR